MRQIENITTDPIQDHTIFFDESEITLTLRFYPRTQIWCFDVEFGEWAVYGIKCSVGVLHIRSQNKPFDFFVTDESGSGIDPFQLSDFSTGRCNLYMLESDDMVEIRGDEVPL
jgi:hypothetical protein